MNPKAETVKLALFNQADEYFGDELDLPLGLAHLATCMTSNQQPDSSLSVCNHSTLKALYREKSVCQRPWLVGPKIEFIIRFVLRKPLQGMAHLPLGDGIWYNPKYELSSSNHI